LKNIYRELIPAFQLKRRDDGKGQRTEDRGLKTEVDKARRREYKK
jgi:hypothetical protein